MQCPYDVDVQVFFSSCNSVKFHSELLNYIDIPVMDIHGRQKQQKRTTSFFQFCKQVSLSTTLAKRYLVHGIPGIHYTRMVVLGQNKLDDTKANQVP